VVVVVDVEAMAVRGERGERASDDRSVVVAVVLVLILSPFFGLVAVVS
jgi:hypothetical protein